MFGHYDDKFGPTILVLILFVYLVAMLIFHVSYIQPLPVLTTARIVRDYRIPLSKDFLIQGDLTTDGLSDLKRDIQNILPNYPLRGNFNFGGFQNVTWFDTRSSCLLRRNGYTLREITGLDISGFSTTNCDFELRTEDWEYINILDKTFPTILFNATEFIFPKEKFSYSRSMTKAYYQNPDLYQISNLANNFNTFFLYDIMPVTSWTENLEAINVSPLYVYYYGTIDTNLKSGDSTSKLASLGVYIWYSYDYTPVWGELSYSFSNNYGQNLTKEELVQSKNYFETLGLLSEYLVGNSTEDITDYVYSIQPTFCL